MANYNIKAVRVLAYDLGTGQGNTMNYLFKPNPTLSNPGLATEFAGRPKITTISFYPGDSATWFSNPNFSNPLAPSQLQTPADMFIKNRSVYWFTLSLLVFNNGVSTQLKMPVAPLAECWLPQNCYSMGAIVGGNTFDSTQVIPSSQTRLTLDFVVAT